jgi:hypothetical protein
MKRILAILVGAVATLAVGSAAQAAVIQSDLGKILNTTKPNEVLRGWTGGSPNYAHSLSIDGSGSLKGHSYNFHGGGINGKVTGTFDGNSFVGAQASVGNGGIDLSTGIGGKSASATFSLSQPAHYFGFQWNEADAGDTITFYGTDGSKLGVVDGDDLLSHSKQGDNGSYYANFTSNLPIGKIVLSTTNGKNGLGNKFDVNCIEISSVPVPAALPMFGAAIAGLGALSKRRRRKAAATA